MSLHLPWSDDGLSPLDRRGLASSLGQGVARVLDPVLGYRLRWRLGEALAGSWGGVQDPNFAPIVVAGCGRSGTTLVARLLNSHPQVFCGDESSVFLPRVSAPQAIATRYGLAADLVTELRRAATQPAFIRRFALACLLRSGKSVWAEKTPENVRVLYRIRQWFPRARIVHVVRDGRDAACSLRLQPWMKLDRNVGDDVAALRTCLLYWQARAQASLAYRADPLSAVLHYEDLVRDPEAALAQLMPALGLRFAPAMLDGQRIETQAVGRWRQELPERRLKGTLARIAPTLEAWGYPAG